jgi:hypothetical protein
LNSDPEPMKAQGQRYGYLENFRYGLQCARMILDETVPEWKEASISVEFDDRKVDRLWIIDSIPTS